MLNLWLTCICVTQGSVSSAFPLCGFPPPCLLSLPCRAIVVPSPDLHYAECHPLAPCTSAAPLPAPPLPNALSSLVWNQGTNCGSLYPNVIKQAIEFAPAGTSGIVAMGKLSLCLETRGVRVENGGGVPWWSSLQATVKCQGDRFFWRMAPTLPSPPLASCSANRTLIIEGASATLLKVFCASHCHSQAFTTRQLPQRTGTPG
jgi:hypothetical protein